MRNRRAWFGLLMLVLPGMAAALCERPWVVNVGNWTPYMTVSKDGVVGGSDVELVRQLASRLKCALTFSYLPPARAHTRMAEGQVDIVLAASDLPERRRYAWFSRPYRQEMIAVLTLESSSSTPRSLHAILQGKHVLLASRYGWSGDAFAQQQAALLKAGKLLFFEDTAQGIAMLQAGRGDLILDDAGSAKALAAAQGLRLQRLFVTNASPVRLMLSHRAFSEADVAKINAALIAIQSAAAPMDAANP